MATTGFWPVKGSLKDVIKYADNPDKTTNPKYLDKDLAAALKYVSNDEKTDKQLFVSAINCPTARAYEQMMLTKRIYGKLGGNVAYHGYQSFREGEVTPEEAHEIGIKSAKKMWGNEYEIVVCTHLNTDNIHNHFVINSVSFKTGRKFENHIKDHIRFREISDEICAKYQKSVLKNSNFYSHNKKGYWIHKNGGLTHRDILKQDVDRVIKQSATLLEFETNMRNIGYEFNRNIMSEHPSVRIRAWKRPIRIDSLGDDYTKEAIMQRMAENNYKFIPYYAPNPRTKKPNHRPLQELEYQLSRVKYMGTLEAMFYLIIELLKPLRNPPPNYYPPHSPTLRQELAKFNTYQKQFKLMQSEEITTEAELDLFIGKINGQIKELEDERNLVDNKRRRAKTDDELETFKAEKREISAKLKPLREKLRLANGIKENIPKVQIALDSERALENKILKQELKKERKSR